MTPLQFKPVFRHYLWGGKRLRTTLNKPVGSDEVVAESWEIVDRADDNSRVVGGEFDGLTLEQLISSHGRELLGEPVWEQIHRPGLPATLKGRFPLLMKFLDANKTLSVQVHPNDQQAARLTPPDLGKTEAWYVIDAELDSVIYAGLNPGVRPEQLRSAAKDGTVEELLNRVYPKPGDCIFVPAGTVHAIGAGLLIAEIQQSSDTTFRLFDWSRLDVNGEPRTLHIDDAVRVTDFESGPVKIQQPVRRNDAPAETLVDCDKFILNRWSIHSEHHKLDLHGSFRLLTVVSGQLTIGHRLGDTRLSPGNTVLIPASLETIDLESGNGCVFLEISAPRSFSMD